MQYVNDMLLIMLDIDSQLIDLKEMLQLLSKSTCLKVIFCKSSMVLINVIDDEASHCPVCLSVNRVRCLSLTWFTYGYH